MQIGLVLPERARWEDLVELASGAEKLGMSSLWLADAMEPLGAIEPLMALAGLARVTTVARLGVLLRTDARAPSVTAKALSTADILSGGRVTAGLEEPPGSSTAELDALGEAVQVMRGAFEGGPFTFHGRYYRCEGLRNRPLPLQRPAPPIWVSGNDGGLLALAARHADGWGPSGSACTRDEYRSVTQALDRACDEVGRDPAMIHRFVRRQVQAGVAEQVREEVAAWEQSGVATLLLDCQAVALPSMSGGHVRRALEMMALALSSST